MRGQSPAQINWAKQAAKRIFKKYNYQGSQLGQYQISSLMKETYQLLNLPFKPNTNDIKAYTKVLDANSDGRVTLEDLESTCIKFLCGDALAPSYSSYQGFGSRKEVKVTPQQRSYNDSFDKYNAPQSPQQTKLYQDSYYRKETEITNNPIKYQSNFNQQQRYGTSDYSTKNLNTGITNQNFVKQEYSNISSQGNNPISNYNFVKTSNQQVIQSKGVKQYPHGVFESVHSSQNYQRTDSNQNIQNITNLIGKNQVQRSYLEQKQEISQNPVYSYDQQPQYSKRVQGYLAMTKQIFQRNALKETNTITAAQVPNVLSQTYETLGRSGYMPSSDDVAVWMKLCDGNSDGHVEYDQYEYFVVRSLERSGVNLYQE